MTAWSDLINLDSATGLASPETVLLVLVLAFCIGHLIGWVYMWTHTGLSYSQSFTASLLILPVILRLLGSWAWYVPKPLGRLLPDVRFGHA